MRKSVSGTAKSGSSSSAVPLSETWNDGGRIHLFEKFGRFFGLDTGSGVVSEFDEVSWSIIRQLAEGRTPAQALHSLADRHRLADMESALAELGDMRAEGEIFAPDTMGGPLRGTSNSVSCICLIISEDCNMGCDYCFAGAGQFGGPTRLMSMDISKAAVDFLFHHAGPSEHVSLSFFGGEPLLNFGVLAATTDYVDNKAEELGKQVSYSITTNATLVNKKVRDFLVAHPKISLLLSVDGGQEIHNRHRKFKNGRGSFGAVSRGIAALVRDDRIDNGRLSLRGTFTGENPSLLEAVRGMVSCGLTELSLEPAVAIGAPLDITEAQIDVIKRRYDDLAHDYIEKTKAEQAYAFFHFQVAMGLIRLADPLWRPCGAGAGYLAVAADGKLYPCHRFVGDPRWLMGNVTEGVTERDISELFSQLHVNRKAKCRDCWAKYHCGGGCHRHAFESNGDILVPYDVECELLKYRLELAVYICAELSKKEAQGAERGFESLTARRPEFGFTPARRSDTKSP